ncbi:MAG: hypothetical protein H6713_13690 [Myxococcales bacterium]|nr:hypothetical protein [Myxococcales bacterium]MCB9751036.1 hypothetical protein [Myxococcales bacterium]
MFTLNAIVLLVLLTSVVLAVLHAVASRVQRQQVKHALRRAFPASTTAFRGQVCTSTGTAFSALTTSMIGYVRE